MTVIKKPSLKDMPKIREILSQWKSENEIESFTQQALLELSMESVCDCQAWILQLNGKTIGVSEIMMEEVPEKKTGKIQFIYIDGQEQGKGYGKIFLEELECILKEARCNYAVSMTNADPNCPAYLFYNKMGYTYLKNDRDQFGNLIALHSKNLV